MTGWRMSYQTVEIALLTDAEGMLGRQCPQRNCKGYFKVRLGVVKDVNGLSCPYCGANGSQVDFLTSDQSKYLKTAVAQKIVGPLLRGFAKRFNGLNHRQRGSLIQTNLSVKYSRVRLHRYQEKQLETKIDCQDCGLEFAVYGRFASCPECEKLNALTVCLGSLETAKKKLGLSKDENIEADLRSELVKDSLGSSVGAFESFGHALRTRGAGIGLGSKANLFQDIELLDQQLVASGMPSIGLIVGAEAWEDLKWFFQARHVYLHRAGVADPRFVSKQPSYSHLLGKIVPLDIDRLKRNIDVLCDLAEELDARLV